MKLTKKQKIYVGDCKYRYKDRIQALRDKGWDDRRIRYVFNFPSAWMVDYILGVKNLSDEYTVD